MLLDEVPWEIVVLEISHADSVDLYNNNFDSYITFEDEAFSSVEEKIKSKTFGK